MNMRIHWPRPAMPTVMTARHFAWLAGLTAVVTFYGSIIPLKFKDQSLDEALQRFTNPTLFAPDMAEARGDWIVSVVLYALLSFVFLAALAVDRPWRRGGECAFLVFAACSLFGVFIEFVQVYFPPRSVSWNDIVVETFGAACGVAVWLVAGQRLTQWFRQLWTARGLHHLARLALPAYVVLLIGLQWMPFDFVIRREELLQKLHNGQQVVLLPFSNFAAGLLPFAVKTGLNVLCFLPLGFLTFLAFPQEQRIRRWWAILALGLVVTTVIEVGQFFVFSRSCDTSDILTGTVAVALGRILGGLVETLGKRAGNRPQAADRGTVTRWLWVFGPATLVVWGGLLVAVEWYPFNFTTDATAFSSEEEELPAYGLRRMSWFPIVDYYWNSKYNTLDQFVKKSAAFAPLGLLAALMPLRRHGWQAALGAVGLAVLICAALEGGRYFLPSHHPSITDLFLGGAGAAAGYLVTRHIRAALCLDCGPPGNRS